MAKSTKRSKRDAARAKAKAAVAGVQEPQNGRYERNTPVPAMSPIVSLIQFGLVWLIIVVLATIASDSDAQGTPTNIIPHHSDHEKLYQEIPKELLGPYGSYPNPLGITEEMRQSFYPVIKFPKIQTMDKSRQVVFDYKVLDLTQSSSLTQLATEEQREARRIERRKWWQRKSGKQNKQGYAVGRYDENRVNLYKSNLFYNTSNHIDGYAGARTLHIGIDLDGPVGTRVYSFSNGIIHSAGYNADLGDYGNVIVVEHDLGGSCLSEKQDENDDSSRQQKVWALYGHLDSKSIRGKTKGKRIKKGQLLGRMGDIHENGGWMMPHVHFQLSIHPPATHDMPGAVSLENRAEALVEYPDPRWVLGPLY